MPSSDSKAPQRGDKVWIPAEYWDDADEDGYVKLLLSGFLEFRFFEGSTPMLIIRREKLGRSKP